MRFLAHQISCFRAVLRYPYEIRRVFAAYFSDEIFPYEISCFCELVMRRPCEDVWFLLHNWVLGGVMYVI